MTTAAYLFLLPLHRAVALVRTFAMPTEMPKCRNAYRKTATPATIRTSSLSLPSLRCPSPPTQAGPAPHTTQISAIRAPHTHHL